MTPRNRTSETGVTLSGSATTRRKTATVILSTENRRQTLSAARVRFRALMRWLPDWQFVWQLSAWAVLFLVTVVGQLLPPVRAYAGLVHR